MRCKEWLDLQREGAAWTVQARSTSRRLRAPFSLNSRHRHAGVCSVRRRLVLNQQQLTRGHSMLKLRHFLALLLFAGFYSSAHAAILCANASGAVSVRDVVCRAGETQLDPIALGLKGPAGTPGKDGANGKDGAAGANGVSGWSYHQSTIEIAGGQSRSITVLCPAGKKPVGWGGDWNRGHVFGTGLVVFYDVYGWYLAVGNDGSAPEQATLAVVCVTALDAPA